MKDFMDKWLGITHLVVMTIISATCFVAFLKFRTERLTEDTKLMSTKIETLVDSLHAVVKQLGIQQAEQAIMNKVTTDALNSVVNKLEKLADRVNENTADIKILKMGGE